jgi:hypothetical protein
MKKTYITPALQETPMDLSSAVAQLTGSAGDNHLDDGGVDTGGNTPGANSRDSWDQFWEDRE